MMCKTGCGVDVGAFSVCDPCAVLWRLSMEWARAVHHEDRGNEQRANVAFVDFCTRIRAERLNGGKA